LRLPQTATWPVIHSAGVSTDDAGCGLGEYMLTDLELMALNIRALFTHDAHGRLLPVNEPGGGGILQIGLGAHPNASGQTTIPLLLAAFHN
jgi:hypothetical protein